MEGTEVTSWLPAVSLPPHLSDFPVPSPRLRARGSLPIPSLQRPFGWGRGAGRRSDEEEPRRRSSSFIQRHFYTKVPSAEVPWRSGTKLAGSDSQRDPQASPAGGPNKHGSTFQISPGSFKCSRDHLESFISKGLWGSALNSLPDPAGGGNREDQIPSPRRILGAPVCVLQP